MWLNFGLLWSWLPFVAAQPAPPPPITHSQQVEVSVESPLQNAKKDWTFLVYAAGDNDLSDFTTLDIQEMEKVGSNDNVNIVVYLDQEGARANTKYLFVEKGYSNQVRIFNKKLDSGHPDTLIDFFDWSMKNYPANHYALVFWNHGSGILDPARSPSARRDLFFRFDPETKMYNVNRNVNFLDFFRSRNKEGDLRGVCFSDTYGSYLTNQKMQYALRKISTEVLKQRIDIVAFDACLMAMIEVADIVKHYAHYMVGSEEIEMGTGWLYSAVLEPFKTGTLSRKQFAEHIVTSYEVGYAHITNDFTQSAIDLHKVNPLKENVDRVASLLIDALTYQESYSAKAVIKVSRSPRMCTHYSEPSYIDLHDFYCNLLRMMPYMHLQPGHENIKGSLQAALQEGKDLINQAVLANAVGAGLSKSKGISIYFPTRYVDRSYEKTSFAKETRWLEFISYMV